jgi:8-oxo-dGTP pyrophosphatase MutT (NUDIX family)
MDHTDYEVYVLKNINLEEIVYKLRNTGTSGVILYHHNLSELTEKVFSYFENVLAAGGLVYNNEGQFLFIKRNGIWDLPKGHMEQGESKEETALREVTEECGLAHLKIIKPLQTTYHIYNEHNKEKLKQTHWFLMENSSHEHPIPQQEEGITNALFVSENDLTAMYGKMYRNIKNLVTTHIK